LTRYLTQRKVDASQMQPLALARMRGDCFDGMSPLWLQDSYNNKTRMTGFILTGETVHAQLPSAWLCLGVGARQYQSSTLGPNAHSDSDSQRVMAVVV